MCVCSRARARVPGARGRGRGQRGRGRGAACRTGRPVSSRGSPRSHGSNGKRTEMAIRVSKEPSEHEAMEAMKNVHTGLQGAMGTEMVSKEPWGQKWSPRSHGDRNGLQGAMGTEMKTHRNVHTGLQGAMEARSQGAVGTEMFARIPRGHRDRSACGRLRPAHLRAGQARQDPALHRQAVHRLRERERAREREERK